MELQNECFSQLPNLISSNSLPELISMKSLCHHYWFDFKELLPLLQNSSCQFREYLFMFSNWTNLDYFDSLLVTYCFLYFRIFFSFHFQLFPLILYGYRVLHF